MSSSPPGVLSRMSAMLQSSNELTDTDAALALITQATKDCIPGVDAVSMSLRRDDGGFETRAETDQLACDGDLIQYEFGEGPCVDAASGEQMVYSGRVSNDGRWRRYGPRAADLGVVSQLALEMYSGDRIYGGLNLYATSQDVFDEEARSVAGLFANQGATAMGQASLVQRLNQALESRKVIGQALGLISERYGVDENRAFGVLTRFSQTSNTKLRVVAADIVATANRSAAGGPVVNGSDPGAVVFNTGA